MYLLKVKNLKKRFDGLSVLNGISFEIPDKSITLFIGPNGSGKSTLVNCISGFYKPDAGKVLYKGVDIMGKPPHEIANLGIIRTFQIPRPFKNIAVSENCLAFHKSSGENFLTSFFKKKWTKQEDHAIQKSIEISKDLELYDRLNALASELSGGQLKLLELCKPMATEARLVLLDEPVGNISPDLSHKIFSTIQKMREERGTSFLIIEHRLDIAMQYVDYVHVLAGGRLVAKGVPKDVLDNPILKEVYL